MAINQAWITLFSTINYVFNTGFQPTSVAYFSQPHVTALRIISPGPAQYVAEQWEGEISPSVIYFEEMKRIFQMKREEGGLSRRVTRSCEVEQSRENIHFFYIILHLTVFLLTLHESCYLPVSLTLCGMWQENCKLHCIHTAPKKSTNLTNPMSTI